MAEDLKIRRRDGLTPLIWLVSDAKSGIVYGSLEIFGSNPTIP